MNGAPDRIRTHDPQIRSLVLYPAELRALTGRLSNTLRPRKQALKRRRDVMKGGACVPPAPASRGGDRRRWRRRRLSRWHYGSGSHWRRFF